MKEITAEQYFAHNGLATLTPISAGLRGSYKLLLVYLPTDDKYVLFHTVKCITYEKNFFDYYDKGYQEEKSIVFLFNKMMKFKEKPDKERIIKEMI